MRTVTFNVSFPQRLLKSMDQLAKREDRSRSEFLREAVRMFVEHRTRFDNMMNFWQVEARKAGYKPEDTESWIAEVRKARKAA